MKLLVLIAMIALKHGIEPEIFTAIIAQESSFRAVGKRRASQPVIGDWHRSMMCGLNDGSSLPAACLAIRGTTWKWVQGF